MTKPIKDFWSIKIRNDAEYQILLNAVDKYFPHKFTEHMKWSNLSFYVNNNNSYIYLSNYVVKSPNILQIAYCLTYAQNLDFLSSPRYNININDINIFENVKTFHRILSTRNLKSNFIKV